MSEHTNEHGAHMVFVTCPDIDTARHIAAALVEHSEAACVNIVAGLESVYRWQGRIVTDAELLLLIKTQGDRLAAVEARVTQWHPDELPEVVAVEIDDGSHGYLEWLRQQTRPH